MKLWQTLKGTLAKRFRGNRSETPSESQQAQDDDTEKKAQQDPQQYMADKVEESGLCFGPKSRNPSEHHAFEFLCWLPGAVKSKVGEMKGKMRRKRTIDDEGQHEEEEEEKRKDSAEHDEGVCIVRVRVIPDKPDHDLYDAMGNKKGPLIVELTPAEWEWILARRKAAAAVSVEGPHPSNVVNEKPEDDEQQGSSHPTWKPM